MSLGFEQAGFDVVACVDYDPVHAAVHEFNFPLTAVICADIGHLSEARLLEVAKRGFLAHGHADAEWTGEIDVIFGGPPCQGFSMMGKRDLGDDRNLLVFKYADLIGAIRPRYFVMENVPGMASGGHASILRRLIEHFRALGYNIAVSLDEIRRRAILSAADFGVPQDRRRLILIGTLEGEHLARYPSMPSVQRVSKRARNAKSMDKHPFDFLPAGPTVWDAIGDLPDLDSYDVLNETDEVRLPTADFKRMTASASAYAKRLRGTVVDDEDFSYPRLWDPEVLTSSARTDHTPESIRRFKTTREGDIEEISRFYRLDRAGLCNTLRAGTGSERGAYTSPRPLHPILSRVISVREAARLHSFPDWFRLHRTKSNGFRSIGNAVPPLFGRAVARQIVIALDIEPYRPVRPVALGNSALLGFSRLVAARYFDADERDIPKSRQRLARA